MRFKVQYDFQAEDEGELTVRCGEIVVSIDDDHETAADGWLLVVTEIDRREGYVPSDYLEKLPDVAAVPTDNAQLPAPPATRSDMNNDFAMPAPPMKKPVPSPTPMAAEAPSSSSFMPSNGFSVDKESSMRRMRTTAEIAQKLVKLKAAAKESMNRKSTKASTTPMGAPRAPALSLAADKENLNEMLALLNDYFAKVESYHSSTLESFSMALDHFEVKLQDTTEKSSELVENMTTLEEIVENELVKWRQINEAERTADVAQKSKELSAQVAM